MIDFMNEVQSNTLVNNMDDEWLWRVEKSNLYFVQFVYRKLITLSTN